MSTIEYTSHTMAHALIKCAHHTKSCHVVESDVSMIELTSHTMVYALIKRTHHTKPRHVVKSGVSMIDFTSRTVEHSLVECTRHAKLSHVATSDVLTIEFTSHIMAHTLIEHTHHAVRVHFSHHGARVDRGCRMHCVLSHEMTFELVDRAQCMIDTSAASCVTRVLQNLMFCTCHVACRQLLTMPCIMIRT